MNLIQLIKQGIFQQKYDPFPHAPDHSSVAMILRPSKQGKYVDKKYQNIFGYDILLLRRKPHNKDYYSGQVCFPGGKIQPDEDLLDAAIRQTFQQTGLQLLKQKHYLFTIKRRFWARMNLINGKMVPLMVNVSFFCINQQHVPIKIDLAQIVQFRWVPLWHFLQRQQVQCYVQMSNVYYTLSAVMNISKQEQEQIHRNFQKIIMPAWNVDLDMPVFGFTLYILAYMFIQLYKYGKSANAFDEQMYQKIVEIEEHIGNIRAVFNQLFTKNNKQPKWQSETIKSCEQQTLQQINRELNFELIKKKLNHLGLIELFT